MEGRRAEAHRRRGILGGGSLSMAGLSCCGWEGVGGTTVSESYGARLWLWWLWWCTEVWEVGCEEASNDARSLTR